MAKKKTFAEAMEQLAKIVDQVEAGKVSLEGSIEKYAEGMELVRQCQGILDAAEKKMQLLARGADGKIAPAGKLGEGGEAGDA